jgi:hypothetical protein
LICCSTLVSSSAMSIGASGESAQAQWASREVQEFTGFE